eukprot:6213414-Pleurochrysis_carterae.AAC.1
MPTAIVARSLTDGSTLRRLTWVDGKVEGETFFLATESRGTCHADRQVQKFTADCMCKQNVTAITETAARVSSCCRRAAPRKSLRQKSVEHSKRASVQISVSQKLT